MKVLKVLGIILLTVMLAAYVLLSGLRYISLVQAEAASEATPVPAMMTPAPTPEEYPPASGTTPQPTPTPEPTPVPTPTPTPEPTPTPVLKEKLPPAPGAPIVTKDPTDETVKEGGSCWFVTHQEKANLARWRFLSPDGTTDLQYDEDGDRFPGV